MPVPTVPTWRTTNKVAASGKYAMHGEVPYYAGDTVEMVTPYYDCSNFRYVMVHFNQICKVLPSDLCQIMYQENYLGSKWKPIPYDAYKGEAVNYRANMAFDHSSYSGWQPADTFVVADNSWWKDEFFDLSDYASYSIVRFKFVIKKGACLNSFFADGWYIDDFQMIASEYPIKDSNSVALSILSPTETGLTGTQAVKVTVKNRGMADLKSVRLEWTVNGVLQPMMNYKGNLPHGFTDTVTVGYYKQNVGYDTIVVWAAYPNGVYDSVTSDDTDMVVCYARDSIFSGSYTVGNGVQYDFQSIEDAVRKLNTCSVGGDINLRLATGIYQKDISFEKFHGFDGYRLIISSIAECADSVCFCPISPNTVKLATSSKLVFRNLTFKADSTCGEACVSLDSGCNDVEFSHCNIIGIQNSYSWGSYSAIFNSKDNRVSNIRFIGNKILYGSYGIYFYGKSAGEKNSRIVFDSNYIFGSYVLPVYYYYTNVHFTHNTVEEWKNKDATNFYYGDSCLIDANRIHTNGNSKLKCGMVIHHLDSASIVSNNEIIIHENKNSCGIYLYPTSSVLINNSVLCYGNSATHIGITLDNYNAYKPCKVRNNIVVTTGATESFPFYCSDSINAEQLDMDYNCWWGDSYIGYAGKVIADVSTLVSIFPSAVHDIRQHPVFRDSSHSLELSDYAGLGCPRFKGVDNDMDAKHRVSFTNRGCYADKPLAANGMLSEILNVPALSFATDTLRPAVVLLNNGMSPITEATIQFELNNVKYGNPVVWKGNLPPDGQDTIGFGECLLQNGNNHLSAYIVSLGGLQDNFHADDTVRHDVYVCAERIAGTYTVGDTGYFKSLTDAVDKISQCGISGAVTLQLLPGHYTEQVTIGDVIGASSTNTLTITSYNQNSESVQIKSPDYGNYAAPIRIHGGHDIIIRNLTLSGCAPSDKSGYSYGLMVTGSSHDIEVGNCRIIVPSLASAAVTGTKQDVVFVEGSGIRDLYFHHNRIEGGATAFYLHGTENGHISNVRVENNEITKVDYSAFHLNYADSITILQNRVAQRGGNFTPANMYLVYCTGSSANVIGNRMYCQSIYYGFYFKDFADTSKNTGCIINNELRSSYNSNEMGYAVYIDENSHSKLYHNSFCLKPTSKYHYGIYLKYNSTSTTDIQNNIIAMYSDKANAYQIYMNYSSDYVRLGHWHFNSNVYYNSYPKSPYIGSNGSSNIVSISDWKRNFACDSNSVKCRPVFVNADKGLQLADSSGITCGSLPMVRYDIDSVLRDGPVAVMGCYEYKPAMPDLALYGILSPDTLCNAVSDVPLTVVLHNNGKTAVTSCTLRYELNGVLSAPVRWSGMLYANDTVRFTLDSIRLSAGYNRLIVWCCKPNGGNDRIIWNDTLYKFVYGCGADISGVFTVGDENSDYATIADFVTAIRRCGIGGPVTLKMKKGSYKGLKLENITFTTATKNITICSESGNAWDVIFSDSNGASLNQVSHIVIKNVTMSGKINGMMLDGTVSDLTVSHCIIISPDDNNNSDYSGVRYNNSYKSGHCLKNVSFIGNEVIGGWHNFYLNYSAGCEDSINVSSVTIDSNIFRSATNYGISVNNVNHIVSVSYNTVENSRTYSTSYGIYANSLNRIDKIVGNRIRSNNSHISYGIYVSGSQNQQKYNGRTGLVANNEIIMTGKDTKYGMYMDGNNRFNIVNNSVYVKGSSSSIALYSNMSSSYYPINVLNNNFVNEHTIGYAIYYNMFGSYMGSYGKRDYNNYYSRSSSLARLNGEKNSISEIRSLASDQDQHSISIAPVWADTIDPYTHLHLYNSVLMMCPLDTNVKEDLLSNLRDTVTTMGCYGLEPSPADVAIEALMGTDKITVGGANPIYVVIDNYGLSAIDSAKIFLEINGANVAPIVYKPDIPLSYLQKDTVFMGSFAFRNGVNEIIAHIDFENDMLHANDTIVFKDTFCDMKVAGIYVIGSSDSADYRPDNLEYMFHVMNCCGVSGDVTLAFENGTHIIPDTVDFSKIVEVMKGHHLTITSMAENRDSAAVTSATSGLFHFKNNENITIRNLTLVSDTGSVILLEEKCSNVSIVHNYMKSSGSLTGVYNICISKPQDTGFVKKLQIIGNRIEGGFYGINLNGRNQVYMNEEVVLDSNEIYGQIYGAVQGLLTSFITVSYNRISQSDSNSYANWFGISLQSCNFEKGLVGNEIDATIIPNYYSADGIIARGISHKSASGRVLFANNIIKVNTTINTSGVSLSFSAVDFYHNTVLIGGSGRGIALSYTYVTQPGLEIKGNILITHSGGYPIYTDDNTPHKAKLDYNTYYGGGTYLGLVGSILGGTNIYTISSLQGILGEDAHSISVPVHFDSQKLKPAGYFQFLMPCISTVPYDKDGNQRYSLTSMGAYEATYDTVDAALLDFTGLSLDSTPTPVYVTLSNYGTDTLKSVTIHWTVNGVVRTAVNWTGALPFLSSLKVHLGNWVANPLQYNRVTAWVSNPNNRIDTNHSNDTVSQTRYLCSGKFDGTYTLGGANPFFSNVGELQAALYNCGVSGPVEIIVRSGNYGTLRMEGDIPGTNKYQTITFTADSGAVAVFDGGETDAGLVCKNVSHLLFQGLVFGNTTNGLEGVRMEESCRNITIRDCDICSSDTATSEKYRAFSYPNTNANPNFPVNVRLKANRITGGYYNIYATYLSGTSANIINSSLYIDSNILTEAYRIGIYSNIYSSIPSISHNIIRSRKGGTGAYNGLLSTGVSSIGKVEGNRIRVLNNVDGTGMSVGIGQNSASCSSSPMMIVNNEIHMSGKGIKCGILLNGKDSRMEVHHNSVYCITDSVAYGCEYMAGSTANTDVTNITRNLFVTEGKPGYPLYLYNKKYGTEYGVREWNNLYSTTYVAYAETALATVAGLQAVTGQDSNMLNIQPKFVELSNGLELDDYFPFMCPAISLVTRSLNGNPRASITAVGCYSAKMWDGVNLLVDEFVSPITITDVICYDDSTPVTVTIRNMGYETAIFDSTPLRIDLNVTGAVNLHYDTLISTGHMTPTQARNITLATIPTQISGIYKINVRLTCNNDVLADDDTLSMVYNASRVDLPYDIDFSTVPDEFVNVVLSGKKGWSVEQGSSNIATPVYGTGRLEFAGAGNPGALANAVFNAINIHGCINPKLSFWYNHVNDSSLRDMTVVLATTDGGATYKEMGRIMISDTMTGWKQHDIDLDGLANSNCLSIVFQAVNFDGTDQNIDRVRITADMDAAIALLPVGLGNVCENEQVPLKVTVGNLSPLIMEFTNDTITAEVTGATTSSFSYVYSKRLGSYESDTLTLGYIDMRSAGNYYVNISMQSQDANTQNDTISDSTLYVYQDVSLDSIVGIDGQMQKLCGDTVWVSALVRNNSNLPVNKYTVRMELDGQLVVEDTVYSQLMPGDTMTHAMSVPYIVPLTGKEQPYYFLELSASIPCDGDANNDSRSVVGVIAVPDTVDLQVLSIALPATDRGRVKVSPKVTVANIGNAEVQNVMLHVDVLDSAMTQLETVSEYINFINTNDTVEYAFSLTYTVPNYDGSYYLKAYADTYANDINTANDTLTAKFACKRNTTGIASHTAADWSVGQNEPNPANATTTIPFVIPEDAEVVLTLTNVNGQLLHREIVAATAGANRVTLHTGTLPSGLYYYGVEYKGQRIVRKMNVVR